MDQQMMSKVIEWIQSNVGEQTSKQELTQKMQGSDLPEEAKSAVRELPEGQHSKQTVISQLQQKLMSGVGGGKGGMTGGLGGGL